MRTSELVTIGLALTTSVGCLDKGLTILYNKLIPTTTELIAVEELAVTRVETPIETKQKDETEHYIETIIAHYSRKDKNNKQYPLKYWDNQTVEQIGEENFRQNARQLVTITYLTCEKDELETTLDCTAYMVAIMMQESQLNPTLTTTDTGGAGLMMLVKSTANDLGLSPEQRLIPEKAIPAGLEYMQTLLEKYNGNDELANYAYTWGMGNVDKWINTGSNPETLDPVAKIHHNNITTYYDLFENTQTVTAAP